MIESAMSAPLAFEIAYVLAGNAALPTSDYSRVVGKGISTGTAKDRKPIESCASFRWRRCGVRQRNRERGTHLVATPHRVRSRQHEQREEHA